MLKRLFSYFKPHMRLFVLDLLCAFFVGLADEFMPLIVRNIINEYVPKQSWAIMVRWSFALAGIYLIKLCLNLVINYWGHIFGIRVQADMRRDIFRHIEQLPIAYFDDHKTGSLMSRITNDLQEVSEMSHHGPENLFTSLVMLGVSAFMLGRINLQLTLIVYGCLPFAILFVILIRKGQMEAFTSNRVEIAGINGEIETSIAGVRVTRAFDGTKQEYAKFDNANARYVRSRHRAYLYLALFNSGMTFFTDIMYVIVVIFGGRMFFHGQISSGDFVAYLLYISMFLTPIKKLVETYEQIIEGMSGVRRFEEIMNLPVEEDDPGAEDVGVLQGDITFDHVSFHYRNHETDGPMVIQDMNLKINQKETLGLVGPSGGGKTTLCNLIPRFYEIDSGAIRIDGRDIRSLTRSSLRRNIGIVAQDVFLFHGTIKENISYGKPDASDAKIVEAARKAYDSLPAGLKNLVSADVIQSLVKAEETIRQKNATKPATKKKFDNPLKVKGKTATVKYKKVKKKAVILKRAKALTVSKAKGKVRFKLLSVKKPKFKKYFKVYSATGNIKVKKKLKKGIYKLVIRVTAAGDGNYKARTRNVSVKVRVK